MSNNHMRMNPKFEILIPPFLSMWIVESNRQCLCGIQCKRKVSVTYLYVSIVSVKGYSFMQFTKKERKKNYPSPPPGCHGNILYAKESRQYLLQVLRSHIRFSLSSYTMVMRQNQSSETNTKPNDEPDDLTDDFSSRENNKIKKNN